MRGYPVDSMSATTTSELRIPADPQYIVVAKRAASAFGSVAGFGVEALDELSIAVAQACENAISLAACVLGNPGRGQVRLLFKVEEGGKLEVDVRTVFGRAEEGARETQRVAQMALTRQLANADLALRVMGLFVDDCRYRVDQRTGGLRVRLTKYRVSS
jgi:serine/threonine-protein kinase RsbW